MSRSGYCDDGDIENWQLICFRGAVTSSVRGKRGQAFLREMVEALDAMPEKRLVSWGLEKGGEVCAIGSVGAKRGVDMSTLDPEDGRAVAAAFGIAEALAREIVWENDEAHWGSETPEQRWSRMRAWAASLIKTASPLAWEGREMGEHEPLLGVAKAPCKSCPYRQDVPSGVWSADEYVKLPKYDGEILDQALAGCGGLFLCHQQDGNLCAGWLATHGPHNLLALRLHGAEVTGDVWNYATHVPVFRSGAEAAAHGVARIKKPDRRAKSTIDRLSRKIERAGSREAAVAPSIPEKGQ